MSSLWLAYDHCLLKLVISWKAIIVMINMGETIANRGLCDHEDNGLEQKQAASRWQPLRFLRFLFVHGVV